MTYESHWYFLQTKQRDLQIVSIIQSWTSFGYEFVSIIQEFKPSVLLVECFAETNPRLQEDIFSIHLNLLMCFEEMYFQYLVFFLDLKLTDSMIRQRSQGYPPFWGQINKLSPEVGLQGWDEMIFRDWYPSKQLIYTNRGWPSWNAIFFWSMRIWRIFSFFVVVFMELLVAVVW